MLCFTRMPQLSHCCECCDVSPECHGSVIAVNVVFYQNAMAQSLLGFLDPSIFNSISGSNNTAGINMLTALAALTSSTNSCSNTTTSTVATPITASVTTMAPNSSLFSTETQMIIDDASPSKQTLPTAGQQGSFLGTSFGAASNLKPISPSMPAEPLQAVVPQQQTLNLTQTVNLAGLGLTQLQTSPVPTPNPGTTPAPSHPHAASGPAATTTLQAGNSRTPQTKTVKSQGSAKVSARTLSPSAAGRALSGQPGSSAKKDGFAVPQVDLKYLIILCVHVCECVCT